MLAMFHMGRKKPTFFVQGQGISDLFRFGTLGRVWGMWVVQWWLSRITLATQVAPAGLCDPRPEARDRSHRFD